MKWEIRQPKHWQSIPGMYDHSRVFCASNEQGEYSIHQFSNKFAIYLDGVAVTGSTYSDVTAAIEESEELNIALRTAMS